MQRKGWWRQRRTNDAPETRQTYGPNRQTLTLTPTAHDVSHAMVPLSPVQCHSVREPSRSPQEALSVLLRSRHARGYNVLYLRESLKGVTAIASLQVRVWRCPAAGTRAHVTQAFHLRKAVGLTAQELGTSTEVLVKKSRAGAGGAQPSQSRAEPRLKELTTFSRRAF
jgi:hypothetical protein